MENNNIIHGPVPRFFTLGVSKQSNQPDEIVLLFPVPGQNYYLLLRNTDPQSFAYITVDSAIKLLQENRFEKTAQGYKLLSSHFIQQPAKEQWDLSTLGVKQS